MIYLFMFASFLGLGELSISMPTGCSPDIQFQHILIWEQQAIQKWEDGIKSENHIYDKPIKKRCISKCIPHFK